MTHTNNKMAKTFKAGIIAAVSIGTTTFGSALTAHAFTAASSSLKTLGASTSIEQVHQIKTKRRGKRNDYYGSARGYKGMLGFRGEFIGSGGAARHGYYGQGKYFYPEGHDHKASHTHTHTKSGIKRKNRNTKYH